MDKRTEEILTRTLFEVGVLLEDIIEAEGADALKFCIESAVAREDMQSAGAMPELDAHLKEFKGMVLGRYKANEVEKGIKRD